MIRTTLIPTLVSCALAVSRLPAQAPAAPAPQPAARYMDRYRELLDVEPGQVADVSNLVIERDAGRLLLERGRLFLLSPVGGRTIGAVFTGQGRFTFQPAGQVERMALKRFADTTALDAPFTSLVLLFADSTAEQLRRLSFNESSSRDGREAVSDLLASLRSQHDGSMDDALMAPALNGETTGLFMARIDRTRGEPLLFTINPSLSESVQLLRQVRRRERYWWRAVTQFPARVPLPGATGAWRLRQRLDVPHYNIEVTLNEAFSGDIPMAATATMSLIARQPVGPWLVFVLDPRLDADSARIGDAPTAFFKADDEPYVWINGGRRLQPGDTLTATLSYHGNTIERFSNWFFVDPESEWFPVNGQGRQLADFDITYHSPMRFPLASIGRLQDSSTAGRVRTTHWKSVEPTPYASFSLGLFETYHVQHPDAPPLDVLISEDAHRVLRQQYLARGTVIPEQPHMRENVAVDVSNALKLFGTLYGPSRFEHYYLTETPFPEGVSFPGLIHLSWGTFQVTSDDGFDEFFRAHESAHQWWGNGVRPESYRDAWLSEGLATFSGLTYVRYSRRGDDQYNRFLDRYRSDIMNNRDAGPIALGYRVASEDHPFGYQAVIYEKGAWVFHMLRALMMDLRTMSPEPFNQMMRDYYQSFTGGAAGTEDFQRLVENHVGQPLDWFFDQWVRSTEIPVYRVAWHKEQQPDGRYVVQFRIRTEGVPATFRMPVLVAADLGNRQVARFRLNVTPGQVEYTSPPLPGDPRDVEFNDLHSVLADVRNETWGTVR